MKQDMYQIVVKCNTHEALHVTHIHGHMADEIVIHVVRSFIMNGDDQDSISVFDISGDEHVDITPIILIALIAEQTDVSWN